MLKIGKGKCFPGVKIYAGGGSAFSPLSATGGTITTDGNFKVHTFNSSGTFQITSGSGDVQYLVVAGGGGAGGGNGTNARGGAGAGGLRWQLSLPWLWALFLLLLALAALVV